MKFKLSSHWQKEDDSLMSIMAETKQNSSAEPRWINILVLLCLNSCLLSFNFGYGDKSLAFPNIFIWMRVQSNAIISGRFQHKHFVILLCSIPNATFNQISTHKKTNIILDSQSIARNYSHLWFWCVENWLRDEIQSRRFRIRFVLLC